MLDAKYILVLADTEEEIGGYKNKKTAEAAFYAALEAGQRVELFGPGFIKTTENGQVVHWRLR